MGDDSKLSKLGDILSGTLTLDGVSVALKQSADGSSVVVYGGSDTGAGSEIQLYGKDHSRYPGYIRLIATNGDQKNTVAITPTNIHYNDINIPAVLNYKSYDGKMFFRRYTDTYIEQHQNEITNYTRGWNYYKLMHSMYDRTYCVDVVPCIGAADAESFVLPKFIAGDGTVNTTMEAAVYVDAEPGSFKFNLCISGFSTVDNESDFQDEYQIETFSNKAISSADRATTDESIVAEKLAEIQTIDAGLDEIIG